MIDCLREMLSWWLKQVTPPPTWAELVDAVEQIDESKAKELRNLKTTLEQIIEKQQLK